MRRSRALAALLAVCLALPPLASAQNPFASELTVDREKEMTAQIHAQLRQQEKMIEDPEILDYVDEIGESLVKSIEPTPYIFRFSVLQDPALNAFTIGGGYVYITTGVLEQAGDVNELAGVLAHEIGHVEKRHVARQSEGQGLATLLTIAGMAAAIASKQPGALIAAQGINVSLQLQHSRQFESEADREGVAIMSKAGYDPEGMRHFFQRIVASNPPGSGQGIPAYLYTHPAVNERIAATEVEINRLQLPKNVKKEDPRLQKMQARLAELMSPDPSGTSGLHARAVYDASKTDPLIAQARDARIDGNDAGADELLIQAEKLEPGDPRVALERADLAHERGNDKAAIEHLQRALALDPSVPLVQYELGVAHARVGDKSRAAFYLEQAVANFRPNTLARRRAELELARLEFKLLDKSGLASRDGPTKATSFERGEPVTWYGSISHRFYPTNPEFELRWIDPQGTTARTERIRMNPVGGVSSTFQTRDAAVGKWRLEVRVEDTLVESHEFDIHGGV